ncbi:MAG: PqqD family protein [Nanoarchaeota archaeon]|nr:PqqD family protein [Nanoarchaeota archaeon]
MAANPKQVKGLVPAKNGDDVGIANQEEKKFYKLDMLHLNVWLLCDGKKNEDEVAKELIKFLKENNPELETKIDNKILTEDVKTIIKKLRKYCLVE